MAGSASNVWPEIDKMLRFGCAIEDREVKFPYLAAQMLSQGKDSDDSLTIVVGSNVNLRSAPNPDAPVVARLSWSIVSAAEEGDSGGWTAVTTAEGQKGHVRSELLRNGTD